MKALYPRLRKALVEKQVSIADIAHFCELSRLTILLKVYGILPWKFTEVVAICRLLGESNAELLFERLDNKT